MLVQGAVAPLFRPGLRADFRDSYEKWQPIYSQYLKESTMSLPELRATIMTGLSRLYEMGDGEPITYDTPRMGPVVMGVDREFGVGFMLTKKTIEDDQYGKANQSAKWLANAVWMTKEYRSAQLLDDAFAGSTFKGIDNLSLCNTAHTLINSTSTVSNALSTPVSFSMTGVSGILDLAMLMKDENGDPIQSMPDKLILGNSSGDLNKAIQIFGSEKEPFTAENQDNAIKKRLGQITPIVNPYKTSIRPWFMIDSKLNDAHFVTRRAPTFEDSDDFATGAAMFKVTTRFLIWFVDWRGWYGSNAT